jgi:hypothetical protein
MPVVRQFTRHDHLEGPGLLRFPPGHVVRPVGDTPFIFDGASEGLVGRRFGSI